MSFPCLPIGMLLGAALSIASSSAVVPVSIAKIVNLDTSGGAPKIEVENTGAKPISAIVLKNVTVSTTVDNAVKIAEFPGPESALQPGQTRSLDINGWQGLDIGKINSQVEIAAVIWTDGTHAGSVADPSYNGIDAVDEIFEQRRGESDEMAMWAKIVAALPKDDHAAIQQYLNDVANAHFAATPELLAAHVGPIAYNKYDVGKYMIQQGMYDTAARIKNALAHGYGEHWVRVNLLDSILGSAARLKSAATEVKQ